MYKLLSHFTFEAFEILNKLTLLAPMIRSAEHTNLRSEAIITTNKQYKTRIWEQVKKMAFLAETSARALTPPHPKLSQNIFAYSFVLDHSMLFFTC